MDYSMVTAEEFGKSLTGLGVNIIVKALNKQPNS